MKSLGISSLLVILVTLVLISFASLSLSTAKIDMNMAEKAADHKTLYYEACNQAEQEINKFRHQETDENSWLIKINDDQILDVEIAKSPKEGCGYKIIKWMVVNTADRNYNQKLNLLQ